MSIYFKFEFKINSNLIFFFQIEFFVNSLASNVIGTLTKSSLWMRSLTSTPTLETEVR